MSHNIEQVQRYVFQSKDSLFLDANVWLSIYGPVAYQDWRSRVYSKAFREILNNRSKIFLDVIVLSEFVNTYARFEFDQFPNKTPSLKFKDFRKSQDFKPIAEEIAVNIKKILDVSSRCNSCFDLIDVNALILAFESGQIDFNDHIIAQICKTRGWILVTHDFDFKTEDLLILTANKRLLNS